MRLALVTQRFTKGDGQGRVNYEIARRALERGHQVTLIATEVAPELRDHPGATWTSIPVGRLPTELARDLIFALRSARWLRRHRAEIEVLHVNGGITWVAGDVNVAHFVHTAWARSPVHTSRLNHDLYGAYHWAYTLFNSRWERNAFRRARRVVAVSDRVRAELEGLGVLPEQNRVILNGVDLDQFRPGMVDRTAIGVPNGVPLALFAGEIRTPRKNLDTVLKALVHVPEMHLAVIGSLEGSPYPLLVQQLGVTERVHFLGYRRDVADLMRAADLFVFPSRYEACSLVLLEALASGLPVITAQTAGGAELITCDAGVVLDDPNDIAMLAEQMHRLADDAALRRQMGEAARAIAERHGWTQMADRYLDLYEEVRTAKP